MKKIKIIYLFICLLPLNLAAQFILSGKILNKTDNTPLVGAKILLKENSATQASDMNGAFLFTGLKSGKYDLIVSFMGFETKTQSIELTKNEEISIYLQEIAFLSDEVIVNASRAADNAPITYSTINNNELQSKNTGVDLPFLLQSTPSLVVSSNAGGGIGYTNLRIRGTDLTSINVTLNGVPVNDPESHAVYFVDLPDLVSSVDNIQIQRGVGTSTNGSAAFGASINIKTESPSPTPFAQLNSGVGSFATFKNTLSFGTGISEKGFSLNGRLSKINSDGFIDRASSDLKSYYLSGSWSGKYTIIKVIATSGLEKTYQSWYGVPKDSLKTNRTYNPAGAMTNANGNISGYYANQTDNYQQDYYQLLIAQQIKENLLLSGAIFLTKGKGYYEEWENDKSFSEYGLSDVVIGGETISSTDLVQQKWLDNDYYGFNLALQHHHEKINTTVGIGWNRYIGKHFGNISWAQFASESKNDTKWYENKGDKSDFNAYAKTIYQLNQKVSLFADLQIRLINYAIVGNHDNLTDLTQSHDYAFFNPKSGISFSLNSLQSVYASVARTFREPGRTIYEDASLNEEIFNEELIDFELGYKLNTSKLNLNSNVFYMDYTNQFVLTGKINEVGAAIMTNVPDSYRFGFEAAITYKWTKKMLISGNLTLSENKIKNFTEYIDNWNYWDDPENQPYQFENYLGTTNISFSPSATVGAQFSYQVFDNLNIVLNSNYVSRQFIDNTSNVDRSLDPYIIGSLLVNIKIKQKIFKELALTGQLNNLFNTKYETNAWVYQYIYDNQHYTMDGYFPQAGLNGMLSVTIRF